MTKHLTRWMLAVAAMLIALAAGTALGQRGSAVGDRPECVTADGQVISQAYGFNHLVHVANHCTFTVDCHVSTDVNPQVQNVHLAPGGSTDVSTFIGSPASVFIARVACADPRPRAPIVSDPTE